MKALISLSLRKRIAKVRSLFAKPGSAIMTLLVLVVSVVGMVNMFMNRPSLPIMDAQTQSIYAIVTAIIAFIFASMMLIQSKMSLFFVEDSYYLFCGPFTQKQVLRYLCLEGVVGSVGMGFFITLMSSNIFANMYQTPVILTIMTFVVATLVMYAVTLFVDAVYLRGIVNKKFSKARIWVLLILVAFISVLYLYSTYQVNWDWKTGAINFIAGNLFSWIPIFGWAQLAITSVGSGNFTGVLIGLFALVAACVLFAVIAVNTKGYFYEQAMIDAEDFTEYYKKAMSGTTETAVKSVHESSVRFKLGEGALFSKNILIAKKTRALFNMNSFMMIVGMSAFFYFTSGSFASVVGITCMYSVMLITSEKIRVDFMSPYTFLAPGSPFKKMMNIIALPLIQDILMSQVVIVVFGLLSKTDLMTLATVMIVSFALTIATYAANVFLIRILKSRSTLALESMLKMLVVPIIIAPAGLGLWWAFGSNVSFDTLLSWGLLIAGAVTIVLSYSVIAMCSPMLSGTEY